MARENEACQALVRAEMKVSRAEDVRKETELIMKPYANWEEYLMPAPLSVAILGQLIFISAGQGDFSLRRNPPPPRGFRYIRHPDSFRACLCQVSNDGWHAFNEAHVNMDQIRLFTATIPERMKLMVQTLFQEVQIVNTMLPGQLNSMKTIVLKCTTLAQSVRNKYKDVISLIHELLEACMYAKTGYERELEEVQVALKQAKLREEAAKKNMKMAEEYHDKIKKQTQETFDQYRKAIDDVPSGWEAVGMTVVESLVGACTNAINGLTNILYRRFGSSTGDGFAMPSSESPLPAIRICGFSSLILDYASGLKVKVVKQKGINFENVYDKRTRQVKTNWVKKEFLKLKNDISGEEDCQPKEQALSIVLFGVDICEQLERMATSGNIRKGDERAIVQQIKDLYQQAAKFDSSSKGFLKSPTFAPMSPNMARYQQESTDGSVWMRNAYLKVEQGKELYRATQEEYQKSFENLEKQNQELVEILCRMENCKVKEIDFETALKMLTQGLKAMGKVKQQWEKMILFFEMISNIIDVRLNQRISDCLEFVSCAKQIEGYPSKSFVTDTIYNYVFSASSMAHLVHMIAETYTEISGKFLMDQVSSLGRLLALESTDPDFNEERDALSQGCEEARQAIYNTVLQKKQEFHRNLFARMETINREIRAVLPPASVEENRMIEQAVQDGRREMTAWEEDQFV